MIKNKLKLFVFSLGMIFSSLSYANWFADIVDRIEKTNGINSNILNGESEILDAQRDILSSQKNIESLMRDVSRGVIGNSGWGAYQFHDYQSYGSNARDWSDVIRMAENGQGSGDLGGVIKNIASQFPSNLSVFNNSISDPVAQKYYALKSQTVLAERAASQLDYNKIQDQIGYQQMLQQQIEKTKDLKSAIDLNNRIQIEGNLINLEILRQVALANQQQAVSGQADVNAALSNARFLTKQQG